MKLCYLFLVVVLATSCATKEYSESEIEKIKMDMTTLNGRLSGNLYRKYLNKNLAGLTTQIYLKHAIADQEPSEREYIDLLTKANIEILLNGEKSDFVVCVKDQEPKLVLCDRANIEGVEKVSKDNIPLSTLIKEM